MSAPHAAVPEECGTVRAREIAARLIERASRRIVQAAKARGCLRDVRDIIEALDDISEDLAFAADVPTLFPMPKRPRRGVPDES